MKNQKLIVQFTCLLLVASMTCWTSFAQKKAKFTLEVPEIKVLPFLMEKNNSDFLPVIIKAVYSGDSCTAVATAEGNEPIVLHFKKGENVMEIPVKAVTSEKIIPFQLEVKGLPKFQTSITLIPVKKLTCYILPHSHTDIGYTEIQTAVEDKQVQNLVKGMSIAKKTAAYPGGAKFIWNVEVGWAADLYLNRMNEAQKKEFMEAVTSGQVALNGMYLNVLTGLCRPEELTRLFKFSTELAKKCNVPINAAMTSDIPGQTWGTVTAMAQAGIKYFSTAPNYFDRIGDILVQWENKPFYWISPSGKEKVLVWIPQKGYALSHMIHKLSPEFVAQYTHQLDSLKYPYDITHLRWSGHGDNAEPDPEISEFVKSFNTHYTWPKFVISSTSTAFEAFEKKYGSQLPLIKGDWTPYWEDGAGSSAVETSLNRASSDRLSQAEALWVMQKNPGYPVNDFENAWKKVLLYSEHTWGAWCSVSDPENKMTKEQWDIKQSYALDADKQSQKLYENALSLAKSLSPSATIEVLNTNSWTRSQVVLIPAALSKAGDVVLGSDKKPLLSQRLSTGELAVLVKDIPAFSSKRLTVTKGKVPASAPMKMDGTSINNGVISVSIDPKTGAISTLTASGQQNNLADLKSGYGINDFAFLDSSKTDQIQKASNVKISIKERGPLVSSLVIESDAPSCNKLIREVKVISGLNYIELNNTVDKKRAQSNPKPGDWKFAQKGGKESVNFAFPFSVPNGKILLDVPYGVMEPEKDQIPSACKNWLTLNRWADVSNDKEGIQLVCLDAPLVEVGGITATMLGSQTNPAVWRKHIEPTQTLFSWAINNHWGTNYRAYQDGMITFRYALRPHQQYNAAENSQYAIGLSQPLIVRPAADNATYTGFYPDQNAILVTGIKPCDDGQGTLVTLFNSSDKTLKTKINSQAILIQHVWMSNSGEDKISTVTGELEIPAWGTQMIRVE